MRSLFRVSRALFRIAAGEFAVRREAAAATAAAGNGDGDDDAENSTLRTQNATCQFAHEQLQPPPPPLVFSVACSWTIAINFV